MFKRRTSRVRQRRQVKVLRASVMSPRIFWFDFRRAIGSLLRYGLVLGLLVAAGWGIWIGVQKGLLENEDFRLKNLVLNENPALDEVRLLNIAEIDLSGSLFDCDPDAIRASLQALPEISRAKVVREFPHDLVVTVNVREPFVWLACEAMDIPPRNVEKGLLVDRAGYVFPCPRGLHDEVMRLPVMELRDVGPELVPGEKIVHDDFDRVMRLYRQAEQMLPEAGDWVESIRLHKSWGCVLSTRDDLEATFGHDDLERQMSDLLAAVEHARSNGRRLATISLVGRRNLPVTFHETTSSEADILPEPEPEPVDKSDLQQILER